MRFAFAVVVNVLMVFAPSFASAWTRSMLQVRQHDSACTSFRAWALRTATQRWSWLEVHAVRGGRQLACWC